MKLLFSTLIFLAISSTLLPTSIFLQKSVDPPVIHNRTFVSDYPLMRKPSEPMLPFIPVRILLPMGGKVKEIQVSGTISPKVLHEIEVISGKRQSPISEYSHNSSTTQQMKLSDIYPGKLFQSFGTHRKNGYEILLLNLYPYQYNISDKTIQWYQHIEVEIITEFDQELADGQNRSLVTHSNVQNRIATLVNDSEQLSTYVKSYFPPPSILPDPLNPFKMIIITDNYHSFLFNDYISWKNLNNISTGIFTIEEIYSSYQGIDNQEKIRNFIIDAYETFSLTDTPLEYVLIGGDDSIVPVRGMYCFVEGLSNDYEDYNIPSDVYYSHLDGNWDENGNQIYGELDDGIDWFAEIAIGRIPALTEEEFNNFFYKTIHYTENSSYSNDIAIMIGQNLDEITWGGDYKNEIIPILPEEFFIQTLYEMDGSYSGQAVRNAINDGLGVLNHLGHSNQNSVFGISTSTASQLNNTEYGFAYSQGCLTAAFDQNTTQDGQAIAQKLVNIPGGFFAFIGNTRYGWYWPGSTEGASQLFDIAFFEGLFNENVRDIGNTLNFSREVLVNEAIENNFEHHLWANGYMLWTFYNQILFGDPSIEIRDATNNYPNLIPLNVIFDDFDGDGDGIINPGETINLYIQLFNLENWNSANNIVGEIKMEDTSFEILNSTANFPSIPDNSYTQNTEPFIISIPVNLEYGNYEFLLNITAEGQEDHHIFNRSYRLDFPVSLKQKYWPWASEFPVQADPVVILDNENSRIVAVDASTNINFLNYDTTVAFDPVEISNNMMKSFAIADLYNYNEKNIIITNRSGQFFILSIEGDLLYSYSTGSQFLLTPVVADITNDGNLEIVNFTIDRRLFVIDRYGEIVPGFPIEFENNTLVELAVSDINNNGKKEIILAMNNGELHVLNENGYNIDNFPINLNNPINLSPIILDNNLIVTATNCHTLYLINSTGNITAERQFSNRIIGEPAAADFTNDGLLDIAFATSEGTLHLINQSGEDLGGFPVSLGNTVNQPLLIVDLNNDGNLNIVTATTSGFVYAFDFQGQVLDMLPAPLYSTPTSPLFISDIDGDGDFEIGFGTNSSIVVLDYKLNAGNKIPWSVYRGNYKRTGSFSDNTLVNTEKTVLLNPKSFQVSQNYPNPFNIRTEIHFYIPEDDLVKIDIFNIKGQRIRTLHNNFIESGSHSVIWSGTNDHGNIVSSGIYFYRILTTGNEKIKKMLLLK